MGRPRYNKGHGSGGQYQPPPTDVSKLNAEFYTDSKKEIVNQDWLTTIPDQFGRLFVDQRMTSSQMRNFYQETRRIWEFVDAPGTVGEDQFKRHRHNLLLLAAKVNYHAGRKDSKVPVAFKDYLLACVKKVKDYKDFKAFMLAFEATVGYFYGYGGESNR